MWKLPALALCLATAGCACDQKFAPGDIVRTRLGEQILLVLQSSEVENFEGYCLVTVRAEDGSLHNRAVEELEAL